MSFVITRLLYTIACVIAMNSVVNGEEGEETTTLSNPATTPPAHEPLSLFVDSQGRTKEELQKDKEKMRPVFITAGKLQYSVTSTFDKNLPEKLRTKFMEKNDTSFCVLPPDTGYWCDGPEGNDSFSRYYYNKYSAKCRCFVYFGCDGNANNFKEIDDCIKTCSANGFEKKDDCEYDP